VAAAVIAHGGANVFGNGVDAAAQVVDALRLKVGVLLECRVQVGNVSLVMLPVVNLHRLRIDVRLECSKVVGKLRKFVRHQFLLGGIDRTSQRY
jgi:hypothetical protein